ncbi:TetR/AcrR family transcriptional regulator [Actinomadura harenae]|uniref:TetR/AcrR family transcriptional regulator n=2 Tax=Actinomadura harenae TaxID=2483351 RepID=A0A3M2LUT0_9ACTN|nr:TetR/AcrR family transcriptional regulator [Actinomadura harenae]
MDPEALWLDADRPRLGRPPAHTRAEITEAAVAIADAAGPSGASAVTMRKVAAHIGAGVMSLYTYVPDRETLLELMIDHVVGERLPPPGTGDWRADVRALAHAQRTTMLAHPWLPAVLPARRTLGPNTLRVLEHALVVMAPTGLPPGGILEVFSLVTGFVASHVGYELGQRDAAAQDPATQLRYLRRAAEAGGLTTLAALLDADPTPPPPPTETGTFDRLLDRLLNGLVS